NTVESLYREQFSGLAKRFGEDAVQSAFIELLEGKIDTDGLSKRAQRIFDADRIRALRERRFVSNVLGPNSAELREQQATLRSRSGEAPPDPEEPTEYNPGALFGFPHNSLRESTWS